MFRTLLFDVDGTLIDSNGAHAEAWTTAMREYGVEVNVDQIRRMIGMIDLRALAETIRR